MAAIFAELAVLECCGREGFAGILQSHLHTVGKIGHQHFEASAVVLVATVFEDIAYQFLAAEDGIVGLFLAHFHHGGKCPHIEQGLFY